MRRCRASPSRISITKAEQLSGDQIVAAAVQARRRVKDLEARREGIFANITDVAHGPRPERSARRLAGRAGRSARVPTC